MLLHGSRRNTYEVLACGSVSHTEIKEALLMDNGRHVDIVPSVYLAQFLQPTSGTIQGTPEKIVHTDYLLVRLDSN